MDTDRRGNCKFSDRDNSQHLCSPRRREHRATSSRIRQWSVGRKIFRRVSPIGYLLEICVHWGSRCSSTTSASPHPSVSKHPRGLCPRNSPCRSHPLPSVLFILPKLSSLIISMEHGSPGCRPLPYQGSLLFPWRCVLSILQWGPWSLLMGLSDHGKWLCPLPDLKEETNLLGGPAMLDTMPSPLSLRSLPWRGFDP